MRLVTLLFVLFPFIVQAQGAATLIADSVTLNNEEQLIASGNVEVIYLDNRLTAQQIIYDQPSDQLIITGPIFIETAEGTLLTADRATLDPQLENGILQGARLVLNQQLQVGANQLDRADGRFSQLYRTVATSCQICGDKPPLWDIRAERIVHDQQARQLYFENATFRIRGAPIFWLPRMRLPDPTLERSNGFLIPRQRNTSRLGTGIKLPYFITLGDHADVTVTPYLAPETRTLEFAFRRAFATGDVRIDAAISDDSLEAGNRSYIFANGAFTLSDGYQLRFDIEATSDDAYLVDYGYSDKDRLDSAISLLRIEGDTLSQASLTYYQTLRDDESNASLPPIVADLQYETRVEPRLGGTLTIAGGIDSAYRYSDEDGPDGRDVTRIGGKLNWRNDWELQSGLLASVESNVRADLYGIDDDSSFETTDVRIVPAFATTLRWPLGRQSSNGTSHLLEPTIQVAWANEYGGPPPNEDSTRSEFDQANLFDISRFAGEDRVETGTQAAFGLTWTRAGANGVTSALTFGRVVRDRSLGDFTQSSGLEGKTSDWLISGQIVAPSGFVFDGQALIDEEDGPTRGAGLVSWQNETVSLAAAYIWQGKDAEEERFGTISEWTFDAGVELNQAWSINLDARYDITADEPIDGSIGVQWRNECVTIDLSASRRFTSSSTVAATTTYGLSGSLNGFSAGRSDAGPAGRCRH